MKVCLEHNLKEVQFNYCPDCGRKLLNITQEEFEKAFDFIDKSTMIADEVSHKKWLDWLKGRHPEFDKTTRQQERADELSQFLADKLSREDYLKSICLIREMFNYLKDDIYNYVVRLVERDFED